MEESVEVWKSLDVLGYPDHEISSLGKVIHIDRRDVCLGYSSEAGYMMVTLGKRPKQKQIRIHVLVATMFIPKPDMEGLTVDHINRNPSDNRVCNLRWATKQEQSLNRGKRKNKEVRQLDKDGTEIKIWDSAKDAAEFYEVSYGSICKACSQSTTSAGFKWEYVDSIREEVIPGELWEYTKFEDLQNIRVSDHGRIEDGHGHPTYGGKQANGYTKYYLKYLTGGKKRNIRSSTSNERIQR